MLWENMEERLYIWQLTMDEQIVSSGFWKRELRSMSRQMREIAA